MDVELLVAIFPQVLLDGLILGFMYALIALGYTMVYGVLEFINFAHSEIFVVGAFVGVEVLLTLKAVGWLDAVSPFLVLLLILLLGMLASGLLAVAVERVAYRPLRGAPRLVPLISAIGVSFFLQDAIRLIESIWRNAFNLVYPSMDVMNERFELTPSIDISVKSLELWLVCEEEATYRQGTDIRTEVRRVFEQQLWSHRDFRIEPIEPFQAAAALPLPATAMHSFHSDHNSVNWQLVVRGEVAHWPPFERGFSLVVYPGEATLRVEVSANVARNALRPQHSATGAATGATA